MNSYKAKKLKKIVKFLRNMGLPIIGLYVIIDIATAAENNALNGLFENQSLINIVNKLFGFAPTMAALPIPAKTEVSSGLLETSTNELPTDLLNDNDSSPDDSATVGRDNDPAESSPAETDPAEADASSGLQKTDPSLPDADPAEADASSGLPDASSGLQEDNNGGASGLPEKADLDDSGDVLFPLLLSAGSGALAIGGGDMFGGDDDTTTSSSTTSTEPQPEPEPEPQPEPEPDPVDNDPVLSGAVDDGQYTENSSLRVALTDNANFTDGDEIDEAYNGLRVTAKNIKNGEDEKIGLTDGVTTLLNVTFVVDSDADNNVFTAKHTLEDGSEIWVKASLSQSGADFVVDYEFFNDIVTTEENRIGLSEEHLTEFLHLHDYVFTSTNNDPTEGVRKFEMQALIQNGNDLETVGNTITSQVDVKAVNDRPSTSGEIQLGINEDGSIAHLLLDSAGNQGSAPELDQSDITINGSEITFNLFDLALANDSSQTALFDVDDSDLFYVDDSFTVSIASQPTGAGFQTSDITSLFSTNGDVSLTLSSLFENLDAGEQVDFRFTFEIKDDDGAYITEAFLFSYFGVDNTSAATQDYNSDSNLDHLYQSKSAVGIVFGDSNGDPITTSKPSDITEGVLISNTSDTEFGSAIREIADIDGDGKMDLLIEGDNSSTIITSENLIALLNQESDSDNILDLTDAVHRDGNGKLNSDVGVELAGFFDEYGTTGNDTNIELLGNIGTADDLHTLHTLDGTDTINIDQAYNYVSITVGDEKDIFIIGEDATGVIEIHGFKDDIDQIFLDSDVTYAFSDDADGNAIITANKDDNISSNDLEIKVIGISEAVLQDDLI